MIRLRLERWFGFPDAYHKDNAREFTFTGGNDEISRNPSAFWTSIGNLMHWDSVSVFNSNFSHIQRHSSIIQKHAPQLTEIFGLSDDSSTQQGDEEQ
jgi:hypothetical protein